MLFGSKVIVRIHTTGRRTKPSALLGPLQWQVVKEPLTKGRIAWGGFFTGRTLQCHSDQSALQRSLQQWRCDSVIDFFAAFNAIVTRNVFHRALPESVSKRHLDRYSRFLQGCRTWPTDTQTYRQPTLYSGCSNNPHRMQRMRCDLIIPKASEWANFNVPFDIYFISKRSQESWTNLTGCG